MTDFERINAPRVEKMRAMLETVYKSARSNKAEDAQVADLLRPLIEELPMETEAVVSAPPQQTTNTGSRAPLWATVREMAEKADLRDLTVALGVFHDRVGQLIDETT